MAKQFSAEHRAKLRAKALLRKHDAATKAKITATLRRKWKLIQELENAAA
jgi:hypothetical protein